MPLVWDGTKWVPTPDKKPGKGKKKGRPVGTPKSGTPKNRDVASLKRSIEGQERRVAAVGEKVPKQSPSAIERIFDVLSRGQYASAEAVMRANKAAKSKKDQGPLDIKTLDDAAKGFIQGFTGKKKTNYHQVLKQSGAMSEGKPTGVAGFVLDVMLDPTTYMGAGVIRSGGKIASEALGNKAVKEILSSKELKDKVQKAQKDAYMSEAKAHPPQTKVVTKTTIRKTVREDDNVHGLKVYGVGKSKNVEMVPIEELMKFSKRQVNPERVAEMRPFIRNQGVEPLILQLDPDTGKLFLKEGDHRIAAAIEEGITHLPVKIKKQKVKSLEDAIKAATPKKAAATKAAAPTIPGETVPAVGSIVAQQAIKYTQGWDKLVEQVKLVRGVSTQRAKQMVTDQYGPRPKAADVVKAIVAGTKAAPKLPPKQVITPEEFQVKVSEIIKGGVPTDDAVKRAQKLYDVKAPSVAKAASKVPEAVINPNLDELVQDSAQKIRKPLKAYIADLHKGIDPLRAAGGLKGIPIALRKEIREEGNDLYAIWKESVTPKAAAEVVEEAVLKAAPIPKVADELDLDDIGHDWMERPPQRFKGDEPPVPTAPAIAPVAKVAAEVAPDVDMAKFAGKVPKSLRPSHLGFHSLDLVDNVDRVKTVKPKVNTKKIAKEVKEAAVKEAAAKAKEAYIRKNAGAVQLKVLGRPVATSKALYQAIAKVGEPIRNTHTGKLFNRAFRTQATFPGQINFIKRMHEGYGVAQYDEAVDHWRKETKSLTKDEASLIAHSIEAGKDLSGQIGAKGADLGLIQAQAKALMDDFADTEIHALGVKYTPISNYVHHFYHADSSNPAYKKFKSNRRKAVGTEDPKFAKERKVPTLREAKDAGLKPEEDIRAIIERRAADHYRTRARFKFVRDVENEFGIKFSTKTDAKLAKKLDLVKANSVSKFGEADVYLPKDAADTLKAIERVYDSDEVLDGFMGVFDKVQRIWKTSATVVNPGHHIRNLVGDVYLNYLDGVVSPRPYRLAMQIVAGNLKTPGSIKLTSNTSATGKEIFDLYRQMGLKSGFFRTELPNFRSKALESVRGISESREDMARMAHFIDALGKEAKRLKVPGAGHPNRKIKLEEAAMAAAKRVQKYNIDYGDLTDFEKRYMKRGIPFYTWMRKNIPLQIESAVLRPGRVAVVPKGITAIQQLLGTDPDEYNRTEILPDWIREMSGIRLQGEGEGRNATYWTPPLPALDPARFGDPIKKMVTGEKGGQGDLFRESVSSLTPIVRIPFELASEQQMFSGAPIDSNTKYASEQVPAARLLYKKLTKHDPEKKPDKYDIINYLTGAGLREITPNRQKGELRRQEDQLQAILRKRNKARRQKREESRRRANS